MSSAARRDLTELTERLCKDRKYFHQFPVIDLDFASYIKAHPSPSHTEHWQHFSLKLFEECRGYEFKDVNVNEEGVIISSDLPSAPYQPDQTCSACWELKQAHSFPQRRITSECQHELDLCLECLQEALQGHIDRPDLRDATKLLCPTCSAEMSYEESSQVEQTRVFPEAPEEMPNFHWCLSPICLGEHGKIHDSKIDQRMICLECELATYTKHEIPWHDGETCEEYDSRHTQQQEYNALSAQLIQDTTKPCPRHRCGHRIERTFGCDLMTCRCGYGFCWLCGKSSKKIHARG
ncbi:hypothetical protein V8E51_001581 [Hyaloscypha variabilis]